MARTLPIDAQRSAVYRAEDRVACGRAFVSLGATQDFVERVTGSPYWQRRPAAPRIVQVTDGRGRRHACAAAAWFGGELRLPRWVRNPLIVLHELAHLLTPSRCAAHGAEFLADYLALVERFLDPQRAIELAVALRAERVRDVQGP